MFVDAAQVHQRLLQTQLRSIFPTAKYYPNARKISNLKYPETENFLEVDVWFPEYKLGFEFQDSHHYVTAWYYHRTQSRVQQQDSVKHWLAQQNDITVLAVPCWWDGSRESLAASICEVRPDMALGGCHIPISLNPPRGHFPSKELPEVGELMAASFPKDSSFTVEEFSWWMGEKYDGVRCCWNPLRNNLYSRTGREITLLNEACYSSLPDVFADGELWFGRGRYHLTYSLMPTSERANWSMLRYISFDVPSSEIFHSEPFENRYEKLLKALPTIPFIEIATRLICEDNAHLHKAVGEVIDNRGEGVILRQANSMYEHGRSPLLVKYKAILGDREAVVESLSANSVQLKLPSGTLFSVPSQHVDVTRKLAVGDVVTFSYDYHARRDVPINPRIYRIRSDISWDDVVRNSATEKQYLTEHSRLGGYDEKPKGYWTTENMRKFLIEFATIRKMDPLKAETWYNIPYKEIAQSKSGRAILIKHGHFMSLRNIFPELNLTRTGFLQASWKDVESRRKFFENYARANSFDSLIPQNWYNEPKEKILATKGASTVMSYHGNNIASALSDLFPNIGLYKSKFGSPHFKENRRQFFEDFARKHGFDSLVREHWHSLPVAVMTQDKGIKKVIEYYGGDVGDALQSLFPEIGIDKRYLNPRATLRQAKNRRKFFEDYAREKGFDPLNPRNWYRQTRLKIFTKKGARNILRFHNNKVSDALVALFPEIGLVKSKFTQQVRMQDAVDRKAFFEQYAKEKKFDPLFADNWYKQSKFALMALPGAFKLASYHKNSLSQALVDLFPDIGLRKSKLLQKH